ncbi:SDR family oxidoreductase [Aestuariirhabdus litorea]|uniref:SDR family oxidoreductase n=1 Tax=Aestuariirhabdus litorea TaxID=2528527 RepID=A0A3P3VN12_9GAMM|nr:SDR family oxidoreductase [Aestuariirhabdus litorea]RRJ82233.1 SDR family oxidoreductase [Aestuariirhabdus litorea]RWW91935.1 SDR family oxidoreductase [Endozoicomonadaceae bacterium GTF-13]
MYSNKVVWITGASSGIGEALSYQFAGQGASLVLSARRQQELERVRLACIERGADAERVWVVPLDVGEIESLPGVVDEVVALSGRVDLLVNNAGVSQRSLCKDTDISVYKRLLDVDVLGQIALTRALLPYMLERGEGQLAVTSSVAGKVGVKYRTGYCAAKHAVIGFFDALRAEVASEGISVSTIIPGFIRTSVATNALTASGNTAGKSDADVDGGMDVDRCAAVILKGLAARKPEIPVGDGAEMKVLWLKRLFPSLVYRMVANR